MNCEDKLVVPRSFSLRNMRCISNAHILTFRCCNNDDADVDYTGGHPIRKVADAAI